MKPLTGSIPAPHGDRLAAAVLMAAALTLLPGCAVHGISATDGVTLRGPFGSGTVGGRIAIDQPAFDRRNVRHSDPRLEVLEVRGDGVLSEDLALSGHIVADFLGVDTRFGLREAWLTHELGPTALAEAGLIPFTVGLEESLGGPRGSFGSASFPSELEKQTDFGGRLGLGVVGGALDFVAGASLGEGFDARGTRRASPRVLARAFAAPLHGNFSTPAGPFLSAGLAVAPSFSGHLDVAHPFRGEIFQVPRVEAGRTTTWNLGYGADLGPVRITHEFQRSSMLDVETPTRGRVDFEGQITAWTATVAWRVTGEPYDSRPVSARADDDDPRPAAPLFELGEEGIRRGAGIGSLEIAARYSNADIDRDFFALGFTAFDRSSQEFRVATAAVNWDPTKNLRLALEVARTIADQRPAIFDSHGRDTSLRFRLQWAF